MARTASADHGLSATGDLDAFGDGLACFHFWHGDDLRLLSFPGFGPGLESLG